MYIETSADNFTLVGDGVNTVAKIDMLAFPFDKYRWPAGQVPQEAFATVVKPKPGPIPTTVNGHFVTLTFAFPMAEGEKCTVCITFKLRV